MTVIRRFRLNECYKLHAFLVMFKAPRQAPTRMRVFVPGKLIAKTEASIIVEDAQAHLNSKMGSSR
jgi:hypothetical protein